jgi:3-oxoacyl-[acyl-carrier protein] reductase
MGDFPETGVAIVTGGSGGVGAAICRRLAVEGCDVVLMYHKNAEAAQRTVDSVEALGRKARAVSVDLRDEAAVAAFVSDAAAGPGGIHTVVTAHGPFVHLRYLSTITPAMFREAIEADAFGAYYVFHAALPHLRKSQGSVVAMGTTALASYGKKDILSIAPKAAIAGVVKGIAVEEGPFGVRANMIGVGLLSDGMFQALVDDGALTPEILEMARRRIALRRLGASEDIANAAVFLASAKAKWISGQTLIVDGGQNV